MILPFWRRTVFVTLALITACLFLGCGGSTTLDARPGVSTAALHERVNAGPRTPEQIEAAYASLENTPGIPGVDYAARRIMLVYKNGTLPPLAPGLAGSAGAAAMPNAGLRVNKQYEPVTDAVAARYGLAIRQQVYTGKVNIASFELPAGADAAQVLARLRAEFAPQVAHAFMSPLRRAQYSPNDPDYAAGPSGPLWDRWKIHCGQAWDITLGDPAVIIAVIDTGVRRSHEELAAQVINPAVAFPSANCDIVNNDKDPEDTDGHGTFIAGVIAAQAENARTIIGVAPHCRVLPVKISNSGTADSADSIAGWVLAGQLGSRVINYSFGSDSENPAEGTAIDQLTAEGVLFVTAAGNENTTNLTYPASYANALCVGSTTASDQRTDFSNYGGYVDIAAPGENLKSCAVSGDSDYDSAGAGTSYSAPMVAAAAGLLWSYDTNLTLAVVRSSLVNNGPLAGGFSGSIVRLDLPGAFSAIIDPVVPLATGVNVAPGSVFGAVPNAPAVSLALTGAQNIKYVRYILDFPPYGNQGTEDPEVQSTSAPGYTASITVPTGVNLPAELVVEYYSSTGTAGSPFVIPVWVFNQPGNVNGDGSVDGFDLMAFTTKLGLTSSDTGYEPFYDSDLDGRITEADASAVGYFYNGPAIVPEVKSVSPTETYTGSLTKFTCEWAGQPPMTTYWDFGGGASPNTSLSGAPEVIIGAVGTYNASLTLSSMFGTDTYDFTLQVLPRPGPTAVLNANPLSGQAPLTVYCGATFSASPGGSIVKYEFSWDGDNTWEYECTDGGAQHVYDTVGPYTIRLRVTDDLGMTAEDTANIQVVDSGGYDNWGEYQLAEWGGNNRPNLYLTKTYLDGRCVLLWLKGSSSRDLYLYWAKNDAPASLSDWDTFTLESGNGDLDRTLGLAANGTNVAVAYFRKDQLIYGEHDGTNFTSHVVADLGTNFYYITLAMVAGKPAIVFKSKQTGDSEPLVHYAYATAAHPTGAADWVVQALDTSAAPLNNPLDYTVKLTEFGGKPWLHAGGWIDPDPTRVIWHADSAQPGPADWHFFGMGNDEQGGLYCGELLTNAAKLGLMYGGECPQGVELRFARATVDTPASSGDWSSYQIYAGPFVEHRDAALVGTTPIFLACEDNGDPQDTLWVAQNGDPQDGSEWLQFVLPANVHRDNQWLLTHGGQAAMLAIVNPGDPAHKLLMYRYLQ